MKLPDFHLFNPALWDAWVVVAVRVVFTILVAWAAYRMAMRVVRTLTKRMTSHIQDAEHMRRAETLTRVFRNLVTVITIVIASMMVLSELSISVAPVLGAAGVVGLAVGFGAQSLVKDYVSGFFLLIENQLARGDVVDLAGKTGTVEDLRLRYVLLRDYEGNVHYVPNGMITIVTNMSRGHGYAVIEVGVEYITDLTKVYAAMRSVTQQLRSDPAYARSIEDELEITGVERLDGSTVTVRARLRVRPLEQWRVRREFLHRLKLEFDRQGIKLPLPPTNLVAR
ncbi:MAG TPA: mechanosensitive ion channel family protein [Steroidobacteraceae bacterium]|jgi:small conductance mechanosensitive channel|nr:mechanosensitive ion channel family protein [Steroidobacteraceae bacterium]